jgi:cell division protein ZapA
MTAPVNGERSVQLDVHILGREFKVGCKENERADLLNAVAFLDTRMREIRDGGKIAGVDRIAVMAALNIANELLLQRKQVENSATSQETAAVDDASAQRRIQTMQSAIDEMLSAQDQLL